MSNIEEEATMELDLVMRVMFLGADVVEKKVRLNSCSFIYRKNQNWKASSPLEKKRDGFTGWSFKLIYLPHVLQHFQTTIKILRYFLNDPLRPELYMCILLYRCCVSWSTCRKSYQYFNRHIWYVTQRIVYVSYLILTGYSHTYFLNVSVQHRHTLKVETIS